MIMLEGMAKTKHGESITGKKTAEYQTWERMKNRCHNANATHYPYYGGRGIVVCDRWRDDFSAFLADMGRRPSASHSIDRIDNDGPYSPENCRWATRSEQMRNNRNTRWVEFNGERRTVSEWSAITGLNETTIAARLDRGCTAEQALTNPLFKGSTSALINAAKRHCPRGHEYDAANTYINKKGERFCRTCNRERARRKNAS